MSSPSSPESVPAISDYGKLSTEQLHAILNQAQSNVDEMCLEAVKKARQVSSVYTNLEDALERLISAGFIPTLVTLLDHPLEGVQMEAAWTLSNVASGNSQQTAIVMNSGAVQKLVRLLSADPSLAEQALWALANISGDGPEGRDHVLALDALEPVLNLLQSDMSDSFLETFSWFIVNLFRNHSKPVADEVIYMTLPFISMLIYSNNYTVENDMVWSCVYLAQLGPRYIQMLVESNILHPLLHKLYYNNTHGIQLAVLDALIALCQGTDEQIKAVYQTGIFEHFSSAMLEGYMQLKKVLVCLVELVERGLNKELLLLLLSDGIPSKAISRYYTDYIDRDTDHKAEFALSQFLGTLLEYADGDPSDSTLLNQLMASDFITDYVFCLKHSSPGALCSLLGGLYFTLVTGQPQAKVVGKAFLDLDVVALLESRKTLLSGEFVREFHSEFPLVDMSSPECVEECVCSERCTEETRNLSEALVQLDLVLKCLTHFTALLAQQSHVCSPHTDVKQQMDVIEDGIKQQPDIIKDIHTSVIISDTLTRFVDSL